jgi:hypothetical protein
VVAGSNPAVPTVGIVGFFIIIALFFFGGFVLLDFLWGRRGGDP